MTRSIFSAAILYACILMIASACRSNGVEPGNEFAGTESPRSRIPFDTGWKFHRGDARGAEVFGYDDASWRVLDLPHDWSIEDIPGTDTPLDPDAAGGISSGYFVGGTGWYRKAFHLPADLSGRRLILQFDGVYMDTDVWMNGEHLGNHPYGYTSFWYDVTDNLRFGERNVVAVRVKNEGRNSRWYSGSGIYRHVWMTVTGPVRVAHWGTSITTPTVNDHHAVVLVSNEIVNHSDRSVPLRAVTCIIRSNGDTVARRTAETAMESGERAELQQELVVAEPELWSVDSPHLYRAVTTLENGSGKLDRVENRFGIRTIEFTLDGFYLNGENLLLKGACMHHDNGPLGAAAFDRAEERRVELMKASGYNSIRCAHNPPSPAFLDACDELGILVIDEAFDMWRRPKNPMDYHRFFDAWWKRDVESMVLRDRNHPSIIAWSTGNEIPERADPEGVATSRMLTEFIHELDPSRPVTAAVNGLNPDKDPFFATLDLAGYNYAFGGDHGKESIFETDHRRVPDRIMYCSESYPLTAFGAWMDVLEHPYVFGDYVWTGYDYLGEASIGWLGYPHEGSFYPWNHAYCGDIDLCGLKRPQSYYRNVLWDTGRRLSVFVKPPAPSFEKNPDRRDWSKWHWHDVVERWNWPGREGKPLTVEVYSGYERVELFLNGTSLGSKETGKETEYMAHWEVPYQPGELKAVGYQAGREAASHGLTTAGDPDRVILSPDRSIVSADGQDLSYVTVELTDSLGHRNTIAGDLVEFDIEGPGTIVAVGSSNPRSTESYTRPRRKAYRGRCLAVVRAGKVPGEIVLTATSGNLKPGRVIITAE